MDKWEDIEKLKNQNVILKRAVGSKSSTIEILRSELQDCQKQRENFRFIAESLQNENLNFVSFKNSAKIEKISSTALCNDGSTLAQLLSQSKEENKKLFQDLTDLKCRLHDAHSDLKILRSQKFRKCSVFNQKIKYSDFDERRELICKLERVNSELNTYKKDLKCLLNEREDVVKEKDDLKHKVERLNHILNICMGSKFDLNNHANEETLMKLLKIFLTNQKKDNGKLTNQKQDNGKLRNQNQDSISKPFSTNMTSNYRQENNLFKHDIASSNFPKTFKNSDSSANSNILFNSEYGSLRSAVSEELCGSSSNDLEYNRSIVDLDAIICENRYLQHRIQQVMDEKKNVLAASHKYKKALHLLQNNKTALKHGGMRELSVLSSEQVSELLHEFDCSSNGLNSMEDLKRLSFAMLDTLNQKTKIIKTQKQSNKMLLERIFDLEKRLCISINLELQNVSPGKQNLTLMSDLLMKGYKPNTSNTNFDAKNVLYSVSSVNEQTCNGTVTELQSKEENVSNTNGEFYESCEISAKRFLEDSNTDIVAACEQINVVTKSTESAEIESPKSLDTVPSHIMISSKYGSNSSSVNERRNDLEQSTLESNVNVDNLRTIDTNKYKTNSNKFLTSKLELEPNNTAESDHVNADLEHCDSAKGVELNTDIKISDIDILNSATAKLEELNTGFENIHIISDGQVNDDKSDSRTSTPFSPFYKQSIPSSPENSSASYRYDVKPKLRKGSSTDSEEIISIENFNSYFVSKSSNKKLHQSLEDAEDRKSSRVTDYEPCEKILTHVNAKVNDSSNIGKNIEDGLVPKLIEEKLTQPCKSQPRFNSDNSNKISNNGASNVLFNENLSDSSKLNENINPVGKADLKSSEVVGNSSTPRNSRKSTKKPVKCTKTNEKLNSATNNSAKLLEKSSWLPPELRNDVEFVKDAVEDHDFSFNVELSDYDSDDANFQNALNEWQSECKGVKPKVSKFKKK